MLIDIRSYEETQETLATLQLMAAGDSQPGQPLSRAQVFSEISGRKPVASTHEGPEQKSRTEHR